MKKIIENKIKFGRVVILGRPNTGKSTLLNAIMSQKVAITSPMAQTTRKNTRVVFENENGKIIFSDTPGIINKVSDLIGKRVNTEAPKEVGRADIVLCVLDISRPKNEEENKVIGLVRKSKAKKILVYNKIDQAIGSKDHLAEYNYLEEEFDKVISVSAIKEKNIKGLINLIFEMLPEKDSKSTEEDAEIMQAKGKPVIGLNSKDYIAEIIREKAYLFLRKEVPYSVNVEVDSVVDKKKLILIKARILTTADRYKKMIIGVGGKKIKEIGYNARKELELMSSRKIFLELLVEIDKHWAERDIER
ncbi:MAG: GTPase Era [Candidatus Shapirobacteria bacterium]|nr:GTPase Era [Candidatus Shapirobacteria bacterium]MDD4410624.1 GTPase Era [Candidatus Shapirobacteria bacterium]